MKIALLGSAACIHSVRWANAFADRELGVHLISAHKPTLPLHRSVQLHTLPYRPPWGYLLNRGSLTRLLDIIQPDVINTHYASGYGTLGTLAGKRPHVLSVWGSDVFDFPMKSPLHRRLIAKNLESADAVGSTSHVMAEQCRRLSDKIRRVEVTPFGVDMQRFCPQATPQQYAEQFTIGIVKKLHRKYGVDTLIEGFAVAHKRLTSSNRPLARRLRLRIVGDGPQRSELVDLADRLGVRQVCDFVPAVAHEQVPTELAKLDIYAAISRLDSESFGVAVVEALACGKAAIVSDAGGLPEVIRAGETGLVVPRENPSALADSLVELIESPERRAELARAGRQDVVQRYSWEDNVTHMIGFLSDVAGTTPKRRIAA